MRHVILWRLRKDCGDVRRFCENGSRSSPAQSNSRTCAGHKCPRDSGGIEWCGEQPPRFAHPPPSPLPPAAAVPPRLVAVALESIPEWFDQIGQVSILPAKITAVDAKGETSFETPAGTVRFIPNTPLAVGSTVRILIEQKPIAQVTVLNDAVMPPPIRFSSEISPSNQAVASWPPLREGEFLAAQIMSMPRSLRQGEGALIDLNDATTRQAALQALQNATDPIRGLVSNADRASTTFLSSLLGQTADPILQLLSLENGTAMEGAGKNTNDDRIAARHYHHDRWADGTGNFIIQQGRNWL